MKHLLFVLLLLSVSGAVFAVNPGTDKGIPSLSRQAFYATRYGDAMTVGGSEVHHIHPFTPEVGYSLYGSRYRKARSEKGWGIALTAVVAPLGVAWFAYGIAEHSTPGKVIGAGLCVAGLGAGIPLWVKGQRELDWMMDDYARRHGPRPHAATLFFGPTPNGTGLALRF